MNTPFNLSPREIDIWNCALDGAAGDVIADRLFISRRTVIFHFNSIYKKMGVSNRVEFTIIQHRDFDSATLAGGRRTTANEAVSSEANKRAAA